MVNLRLQTRFISIASNNSPRAADRATRGDETADPVTLSKALFAPKQGLNQLKHIQKEMPISPPRRRSQMVDAVGTQPVF